MSAKVPLVLPVWELPLSRTGLFVDGKGSLEDLDRL